MSEAARRAVRLHSKATGGDLACLLELAGFCDERYSAFVCWPSQRTLANFLHVNERTVRDYIAHLKTMGEVTAVPRGRRNYYTLCLPEASEEEYKALLAPHRVNSSYVADIGSNDPEYIGSNDPEYIGSNDPQHRVNRPYHMKGSETENEKKNEREIYHPPILESVARERGAATEYAPSPLPPSPYANHVWRLMQDRLKAEMTSAQFETWFRGTSAVFVEQGVLRILVRTRQAVDMLTSRYGDRLQDAARDVAGEELEIEIATKGA